MRKVKISVQQTIREVYFVHSLLPTVYLSPLGSSHQSFKFLCNTTFFSTGQVTLFFYFFSLIFYEMGKLRTHRTHCESQIHLFHIMY